MGAHHACLPAHRPAHRGATSCAGHGVASEGLIAVVVADQFGSKSVVPIRVDHLLLQLLPRSPSGEA